MFEKLTTIEKFTNAVRFLESRGGKILIDGLATEQLGDNSVIIVKGTAKLKMGGFVILLTFTYDCGLATFFIVERPLFVSEHIIQSYIISALE